METESQPRERRILQIRGMDVATYDQMRAEMAYRKMPLGDLIERIWEVYKESGKSIWAPRQSPG